MAVENMAVENMVGCNSVENMELEANRDLAPYNFVPAIVAKVIDTVADKAADTDYRGYTGCKDYLDYSARKDRMIAEAAVAAFDNSHKAAGQTD